MCSLNAIYAYHPDADPVSEAELLTVRDTMIARGPDGAGLWRSEDRRVGFGHRRLAIIDLSPTGAQPMSSADGSLSIVFNGEIYNYRALREELLRDGRVFVSESDTEVLLHLYERDGPDMVRALRGMFAFTLWDARRGRMLLARDAYGIKPLYYADDGKTFRAASQVRALLAGSGVGRAVSPAGLAGFFTLGSVPDPHTIFQDIHALPAGTTMIVDRDGARPPSRYFSLHDELQRAAPVPAEERADRFRAALEDSVRHHLVADVPVGLFLSSGLDSATLTGLAAEQKTAPVRAVTLGFDEFSGTPTDEVPMAREIAALYGADHHVRHVSKADFAAEFDNVMDAMDQPSIDGVNTYFVSKATAESGLKVAISGLGGDELLGGYPSFYQVPQLTRLMAPFRMVPAVGRWLRYLSAPLARRISSPKYAGAIEYGMYPGDAYLLRSSLFMPWELNGVLAPDVASDGWRALDLRARLAGSVKDLPTSRLEIASLETCWYMQNQLLRDSDWASMAHSLEIRVPLVDSEFLKSVAALIAGAEPVTKQDMAAALRPALPANVLNRPKTGFSIPVQDWLLGGAVETGSPPAGKAERGLRGWSRLVMREYLTRTGADLDVLADPG